jgi:DNA-binding SARP family transcriptional activator
MAAVEVRMLGTFSISVHGQTLPESAWRRRAGRQLLKCLLTRSQRRLLREEALDLFWPDSDPAAAATSLRSAIHTLRHALESAKVDLGELILADRESLRIRPGANLWVDADAFDEAVARAATASDPLPYLEQADALYLGDYLPEDVYEDWSSDRRERLRRAWVEVQLERARIHSQRGAPERAVEALEHLLQLEATNELAARELMRAVVLAGRRNDVIRVYSHLREALQSDLGVEPSPETTAAYRRIVEEDDSGQRPAGEATGATVHRCAYPFPSPARIVGRSAQLERLTQLVDRARSRGAAAVISGPAGTGKSALAGTILRRAESAGAVCLAGAGYRQEGVGLLGPFHDILASYLLPRSPEQLRSEFGQLVDDLVLIVPELRYQLEGKEAHRSTPDRLRIFGAVNAFVRALASRQPVVLCIEDLHAADTASIQLFGYLTRQTLQQASGLPVLLMATQRDEGTVGETLGTELAALQRDRLVEVFALAPFNRTETSEFATSLLEGPTAQAFADWLHSATEGNPLFIEQFVLALREEGRLERRAGMWRSSDEQEGAFPRVIQDLILSRLERLPPRPRETLAIAAVLGQTVDYDVLLSMLHPREETGVLEDLAEAIDAHFLQEAPTGYAFAHDLVRQAIYQRMSSPRRMLLHARVAVELENLSVARRADYSSQLAHHFALAGHASEVRSKALAYSMQAGRGASALSAYNDVLVHFDRATELIQKDGVMAQPGDLVEALQGRGAAQRALALWPEALASFREALVHCDGEIQRAHTHYMLAYVHLLTGQVENVLAECESGLAELESRATHEALLVRLRLQELIGHVRYLQGRYHDMAEIGSQMIETAKPLMDPWMIRIARSVRSWGCMALGDADEALRQHELSVASAEVIGDKVTLAIAHENIGLQLLLSGNLGEARRHVEAALALYRDAANESRSVHALQHLARIQLAEGSLSDAERTIRSALEVDAYQTARWAGDTHHVLGSIQAIRCQWEDAAENLARSCDFWRAAGNVPGTVDSIVSLALVRQHSGAWLGALDLLNEAVDISSKIDRGIPAIQAHRARGRLRLLTGDRLGAESDLELALSTSRGMSPKLEEASCAIVNAEFCVIDGLLDEAGRWANQAVEQSASAAHQLEALTLRANVQVACRDWKLAAQDSDRAIELAVSLGAYRLLSLARLAGARAAAARDRRTAIFAFEAAVRDAEVARAPWEHAVTLRGLAEYLESDPRHLARAEAARVQADKILLSLDEAETAVSRSS